jgi:Txe/YoeB family toxin of Txe-Axe toxin-antitoxin module
MSGSAEKRKNEKMLEKIREIVLTMEANPFTAEDVIKKTNIP